MATTVVGLAGASGLAAAAPREDSGTAVAVVAAAWSAQQRETDTVVMGALAKAHEALAASEAHNAASERELVLLRAAMADRDSVYREELVALQKKLDAEKALNDEFKARSFAEEEAKRKAVAEIAKHMEIGVRYQRIGASGPLVCIREYGAALVIALKYLRPKDSSKE